MKKTFLLLVIALQFFNAHLKAQTFTVDHDTISVVATTGTDSLVNNMHNLTAFLLVWRWSISETNFPSDWKSASKICNTDSCFSLSVVSDTSYKRNLEVNEMDCISMKMNFSALSSYGTYFVTIKLIADFEPTYPSQTSLVTYIVSRPPPAAIQTLNIPNEISLYPNPTSEKINLLFNADAHVSTVNIYNLTGEVTATLKVAEGSDYLNIDISDISKGFYIARILNNKGDLIAIKRFEKL